MQRRSPGIVTRAHMRAYMRATCRATAGTIAR